MLSLRPWVSGHPCSERGPRIINAVLGDRLCRPMRANPGLGVSRSGGACVTLASAPSIRPTGATEPSLPGIWNALFFGSSFSGLGWLAVRSNAREGYQGPAKEPRWWISEKPALRRGVASSTQGALIAHLRALCLHAISRPVPEAGECESAGKLRGAAPSRSSHLAPDQGKERRR